MNYPRVENSVSATRVFPVVTAPEGASVPSASCSDLLAVRGRCVRRLTSLAVAMSISVHTIQIAVLLFDLALPRLRAPPHVYPCVLFTCLGIAAKLNGDPALPVDAVMEQLHLRPEQLTQVECKLLTALNWEYSQSSACAVISNLLHENNFTDSVREVVTRASNASMKCYLEAPADRFQINSIAAASLVSVLPHLTLESIETAIGQPLDYDQVQECRTLLATSVGLDNQI